MSPFFHRPATAFVVAAFFASSCGGGSPSTGADPSSSAGTESEVDEPTDPASRQAEGDALINEVLASFDPENLDANVAEAAALDRTVELEMAEWSGLEEALGGPDATSAAFASHDQFYATLTDAVTAPPQLGFRRGQADGPSFVGGLFGGYMLVAAGSKAVVQASNDGTTGTATPAKGYTLTATAEAVELALDLTHESDGLTTKLKIRVKIVPCPDVNGVFTVEAAVDVSASAGGRQQNGKLDVKVTGQLNDNAELASSSSDFRLKRDGLGMGAFVDSSVSYASDGTGSTKLNDFNWFTTKPEDFSDNTALAAIFGIMIQTYLLDAAEEGYMSGRCVEIGYGVSPGTTGLTPGSSATITARPRAQQDGVPTGGTVQALLSAGGKSVDPSSTPIPVDAEFEYGAPDEPNKTGTVALEARSRRGVGKAKIDFDTAGSPTVHIAGPVTYSLMGAEGTALIDLTLAPDPDGSYTGTASLQVTGGFNFMQTSCTSATWTESIDLMATLTTENDEQVLVITTIGEAPRGTPVATECTTAGVRIPSRSSLLSSSLFGEVRIRVVSGDQAFVDTVTPGIVSGTVSVTVT